MAARVPFEFVDDEEMQAIEAALQAAGAIEDDPLPDVEELLVTKRKRSLCVTDVTSLEWCESQFYFAMNLGKPQRTPAMAAGNARHVELETEVVTRVDVRVESREDSWAVRLLNFTLGAKQLLALGMTREVPVLAFVEGVWITGVIDELRLEALPSGVHQVQLVDTKTRMRQTLPSEAQRRNGRLQLMCYKLLWDTMCQGPGIHTASFAHAFGLEPRRQLSQSLLSLANQALGSKVNCLEDVLQSLKETCTFLPLAHTCLKLRYEWQVDKSVLGEQDFEFDPLWLMNRLQEHLDFWQGRRVAHKVPQGESWKCQFCAFVDRCQPKWP